MAAEGSAGRMRLVRGNGNKDAEIARLNQELEEVRGRLEEVSAYYRAQLQSAQQRVERDAMRNEANEVARRRRAEEQVAYLKGELQAARSEAEHSTRRYKELAEQLERLENESEKQTRQEVDRFRAAASASWKAAEEEMAKLDQELGDMEKKLAWSEERRRQLEESLKREKGNAKQVKEAGVKAQHSAKRSVEKLQRALKASETRRKQLEAALKREREGHRQASAEQQAAMDRSEEQLRAVYASFHGDEAQQSHQQGLPKGDNTVHLDLANLDLGSSLQGELSEEFQLLPSDDSIYRGSETASGGGDSEEFVVEAPSAEESAGESSRKPEPTREAEQPAEAASGYTTVSIPREDTDDFGGNALWGWLAAGGVALVAVAVAAYFVLA